MLLPRKVLLFSIGGATYTGLELLWRRRSHWSMFCLGGICFLAIGHLDRRFRLSTPAKMVAGSAVCTTGELLTGLALNRDHRIWDYSRLPLNYRGQICLPFSLIWMPLSLAAAELYRQCDERLPGK